MPIIFTDACIPNMETGCVGGGSCDAYEDFGGSPSCCERTYVVNLDSSGLNSKVRCELPQPDPEPPKIVMTNFQWNKCSGTPVGSTVIFGPCIVDVAFFSGGLDVDDDLQITIDGSSSTFEAGNHTGTLGNALQTDCEYSGEVQTSCNKNYNITSGTILCNVSAGSTVSFGPIDQHGGGIRMNGRILLKTSGAP